MGVLFLSKEPARGAANDVQPDWREDLQNTKKADVSAKALQATGVRFADRTVLPGDIVCANQSQLGRWIECSTSLFFGNILIVKGRPAVGTGRAAVISTYGSVGSNLLSTVLAKGGSTVTDGANGKFDSTCSFHVTTVFSFVSTCFTTHCWVDCCGDCVRWADVGLRLVSVHAA